MSSENKKKTKKEQNQYSAKKQNEINKRKKRNADTDSDENNSSGSESDETNVREYDKFLSKIFPSKYIDKKIRAKEELKKIQKDIKTNKKHVETSEDEDENEDEDADEKEHIKTKNKKKYNVNKKIKSPKENSKNKKYKHDDNDDDDDDDDDDDNEDEEDEEDEYDNEEDTEEEEEEDIKHNKKNSKKLNIIFTIGGASEDEDEDEWETDYSDSDYEDDDYSTENEDESVSSDEESDEDIDNNNNKTTRKSDIKNKKTKDNETLEKNKKTEENAKSKDNKKSNEDALLNLKELLNSKPHDKTIKKCIDICEKDMKKQKEKQEKKEEKHKAKNLRIFKKIVKDKNTMNDFSFYEKLEITEQKKIIKELREINKITRIEKPYRMTLLESDIPVQFKAAAIKKINSLRYMEPGSGEFYKIKNWVDTFMRIPFGKNENLPISIDDGVEKCHEFMENAQKTLDSAVYGLNDAKMQIMQMLGQLLTNPKAIGTAIAIHGPPGTGKTSLVKEGISKILNRPFAFIALGGATDSSFLEGHSYTYEGSTWGKIVQILINSNCMNPVIYFDELDKISDTPRGEEIAGILTHLTDTSQNSQFHDKYFAEINFDLSKCLFIFSYNDETKVNPILKDRMYRIMTKGYSGKEKIVISNNYLLPKIREQVKFNSEDIIIPETTVSHIIDTYCNKEDGVRNLKRCLEIIYTKLNLYRLMKPGSNLFEREMSLQVEFPYTVTKDIVDKLIKRDKDLLSTALYSMYV
jgi:ATP-dependent Lon protease